MRNVLALMVKELKTHFNSPVAYVVLGGFMLLAGLFFDDLFGALPQIMSYVGQMQNPEMLAQLNLNDLVVSPLFQNLTIILLLVVPLITMRVFAEEKRQGTDELLMTSPISIWQIVLGKFLSAFAFYTMILVLTLIFPVILAQFGALDYGKLGAAYLGLILMGGAFIAIGVFASSLTASQVVAAVSTFAALLIFWIIGWMSESLAGARAEVFQYIALTTHFANFIKGAIHTKDIIFFLSFVVMFVFLTIRSIESSRWSYVSKNTKVLSRILAYEGFALLLFALLTFFVSSENLLFAIIYLAIGLMFVIGYFFTGGASILDRIKSKGTKYGANAFIYTTIVLALVVAGNWLGVRHNIEWDATSIGSNTLADQTLKILDNLEQPVTVAAVFKSGESGPAKDLLERYARRSEKFSFEMIDPDHNPEKVAGLPGITDQGQMVIKSGDRSTMIVGANEEQLTNAIIKVRKAQEGALYFLTGHGEVALDNKDERGYFAVRQVLENENYVVRDLLLESMPGVPFDCQALIVAGPTKTLPEPVLEKIRTFLDLGGHAVFFLDPRTNSGLEDIATQYGVAVQDDIIVDQQLRMFEGATLGLDPIIQDFPPHEITENFSQPIALSQARSLSLADKAGPGMIISPLARTSASSWGETSMDKLFDTGEVVMDETDLPGPLTVAAAVSREVEPKPSEDEKSESTVAPTSQARLVVVGDSDFAANANVAMLYNGPFFMNIISWAAGEKDLIAIAPKSYPPIDAAFTPRQRQQVFIYSVFLIPQVILILGIFAILRRRGR